MITTNTHAQTYKLSKKDFRKLAKYVEDNYEGVRDSKSGLQEYGVGEISLILSKEDSQVILVGEEEERENKKCELEELAKVELGEIF